MSSEVPGTPPVASALNSTARISVVSPAGGGPLAKPLEPAAPEPSASAAADEALVPQREELGGLTAASLKHLRRQRDALAEEKARLQAELAALQERFREQRERAASLELELREAELREAAAQEVLRRAEELERAQRCRAEEAERKSSVLEAEVARRELEIARWRESLEEQRQLTKDVCEAAAARLESAGRAQDLEARVRQVQAERDSLQHDSKQHAVERDELKRSVAMAMAAAEKAMAMHALHTQAMEQLRAAKLEEAMNHKVELHIMVPRVTLSYNNAPPLHVSTAVALSEQRVREFLEVQVFPHFEPMWLSLDRLARAPDGSTKKDYATGMLDRLAGAIKAFIMRSQLADGATLGPETASSRAAGVNGRVAVGPGSVPAGGRGSLTDADRQRLLEMLRSGDDQGLDSKLQELLEA